MLSFIDMPPHPSELFRTDKGAVFQDDQSHKFILEFKGKQAQFKVSEFLQFKRSIDKINLQDLFLKDVTQVDIEIIHHFSSGHLFVFTLCELIAIRELLHGTMTMLELQRIISEKLQPMPF